MSVPNNSKSKKNGSKKPSPRSMYIARPRSVFLKSGDTTITQYTKTFDGSLIQTGAANIYGSYGFKLSDLPEVASFTDLYDQYRFDYIEMHIIRTNQLPIAGTGGTPTVGPLLYVAIDYDDIITPTSTNQLLAYENVTVVPCGESRSFRFKPHSNTYMWDGSASVAGGNVVDQWIDAAQTGVLHLGVKWAAYTHPQYATWRVLFKYTFSCKNIR